MDSPPKKKLWIPEGINKSRFQKDCVTGANISVRERYENTVVANIPRGPVDITIQLNARKIEPPEEDVYVVDEYATCDDEENGIIEITCADGSLSARGFDITELTVFENFDLLARLGEFMTDAWKVFGIDFSKQKKKDGKLLNDRINLLPYEKWEKCWYDPNLRHSKGNGNIAFDGIAARSLRAFKVREMEIARRELISRPQVQMELMRELCYSEDFANGIVLHAARGLQNRPENLDILHDALQRAVKKISREAHEWMQDCYFQKEGERKYFGKVQINIEPATRRAITRVSNPALPRKKAAIFLQNTLVFSERCDAMSLSEARAIAIQLEKDRKEAKTKSKASASVKKDRKAAKLMSEAADNILKAGWSYHFAKRKYAKHHFRRVTKWLSKKERQIEEVYVIAFLNTIDDCCLRKPTADFSIGPALSAALEACQQRTAEAVVDEWDKVIAEELMLAPTEPTNDVPLDENNPPVANEDRLRRELMHLVEFMKSHDFSEQEIQIALTKLRALNPESTCDESYQSELMSFGLRKELPRMPFKQASKAWTALQKRLKAITRLNEENQ